MSDLLFMAIESIEGEEPLGGDQKLIRIHGFQHSLKLPISPARPSVGQHAQLRRSYCEHGLFTVYKSLDKTSPKIFEACAKGQMIEHVAVYLCGSQPSDNPLKKGEFGPEPALSILLKNVVIAAFDYELKPTMNWPLERVDFHYATVSWKLKWKDPEKGTDANLPAVGWDGLLNKAEGIDIPASVKYK